MIKKNRETNNHIGQNFQKQMFITIKMEKKQKNIA